MTKRAYIPLSIALLLAVLAVAFHAWRPGESAVQAGLRRIAMVRLTAVDDQTAAGFKAGMTQAGYQEGTDVVYLDPGPAGSIERLDAVVLDHLKNKPDMFISSSTPATQAVRRLTEGKGIPIVFASLNDPLGAGVVANLKHPGGMITGVRLPTGEDLRLQWLTKIAPGARRVWVPYTAEDKSARITVEQIGRAAPGLGLTLLPQPVRGEAGTKEALAALPADVDAIFLVRDSSVNSRIALFVAKAVERRLPLSGPSLTQVQAGALYSYGFSHRDIGRQAAHLADQIFKGTSPGDLPVEMAESVLSLNLVTARRIGVEIPDRILLHADQVIRE